MKKLLYYAGIIETFFFIKTLLPHKKQHEISKCSLK